ncbi:RNA polymerase sigma factor FliA [mine drainage metagenome]|jgi:RNA polymerase sigma factor for flagellar operon FliA|uniref:RNA polymerase sigma factor FliA n=1 Tax=mine drainage metagenome TaxID=410659 RepID=A0A1J5Q8N1_9ZZZZ
MKAMTYAPHESREERLARHLPLVRRIAGQMAAQLPASVDLADLEQAGMIGLWDALERGQEQAAAQFGAYAAIRIRGAIYDELRRQDWLPRRSRVQERAIQKTMQALTQSLGRPPEDHEVAAALGWTLDAYQSALAQTSLQLLYLEDLAPGDGIEFTERHADASIAQPDAALQEEQLERDLRDAIQALPERERLILSLYYQEELQLKEIGQVLEVSESRVSQLMKQAVMRLRASLQAHGAAPVR